MDTTDKDQERASQDGERAKSNDYGSSPDSQHEHDLAEEIGRLAQKFVEVVEVAWNSEQRKRIEEDLNRGLVGLAESLEGSLKRLGEREQTKEFLDKAEDVAEDVSERVRTSKVANDLAAGLAAGLRTVSEKLDELSHEMQSGKTAGSKSENTPPAPGTSGNESAQDIPIEPKDSDA